LKLPFLYSEVANFSSGFKDFQGLLLESVLWTFVPLHALHLMGNDTLIMVLCLLCAGGCYTLLPCKQGSCP
jgi:hypothetical protein